MPRPPCLLPPTLHILSHGLSLALLFPSQNTSVCRAGNTSSFLGLNNIYLGFGQSALDAHIVYPFVFHVKIHFVKLHLTCMKPSAVVF